ncbi:MAG TPA: YtxH domain-containing protein [Rhabdochlamydiaceae bacterium]
MYDNHRQSGFIWGALVGGAIATLTTLLFTTKKGKQIQRQIGDLYEEIEGNAKDVLSDAKDAFSDVKDKLEETADHAGAKIAHKTKHDTHHTHHKDSK